MTNKAQSPSILLTTWDENASGKEMRSAFRRKNSWVYHSPQSLPVWYATVVGNLTGAYTQTDPATINNIRVALNKGFARQAFEKFKFVAGLTSEQLGKVVGIPPRTLARRERFKPDESERLLRVASVFQRSLEVFEDIDKARHWFVTPRPVLGNFSPLEYCDTEPGAEEVANLLGRIEHGVFS